MEGITHKKINLEDKTYKTRHDVELLLLSG